MFGWLRDATDEVPFPTSVRLEGDLVRVFSKDQEIQSFNWSQLESVRTWKRDCLAYDVIWVSFDLVNTDKAVDVHEEMEGYKMLIEEMQRRCHGFDEKWWGKVAFPAFQENHAYIWERPDRPKA